MMTRQLHWRSIFRWGLVFAWAVLVLPEFGEAQSRRGGRRAGDRRSRIPKVRIHRQDPNQDAAAAQRMAADYLRKGKEYLRTGNIPHARTQFRAAIELAGMTGPGQAALGELKSLHAEGMRALVEAQKLYGAGKYREALKLAEASKVKYAGLLDGLAGMETALSLSHLFRQFVEKIEADPKAAIEFQEFEASKRAKKLARLEKRAIKDPRKYFDLYKTLKTISTRFPLCPTGKRCAGELEELKSDKKIWKTIKREEKRRFVRTRLQLVDQLRQMGLMEDAAREYKKLKSRFPRKTRAELREMAKG